MEIDDADVKSGVPMQGLQVQQVITYRTNLAGPLLPALPLFLMLSL